MRWWGPCLVTECASVVTYNLYFISCLMFSFCSHFSSEILTFCLQNFGNSKSCSQLGCHFIKHINVKERTQTTSISTTQVTSMVFLSTSPVLPHFSLWKYFRKIFIIICWLMSTLGIAEAKWVLHITWQYSVWNRPVRLGSENSVEV